MTQQNIHCYIRTHRKKSGFTQRELATVLGYDSEGQVSRHERANVVPPFLVALGYEVVFRVPVAELFPGVYGSVEHEIEARLAEMEEALQQKQAKGTQAKTIARKLEWFSARRNAIEE